MSNDFDLFFESNYCSLLNEGGVTLPFKKAKNKNIISFETTQRTEGDGSNKSLTNPAQTDKPPVEGNPRYVAKRNRRLRSRYRNIQVFDNKTKTWADTNTRYTKFKDANASIEKMNPSD